MLDTKKSAFTLIELMIVIVIIGVMAGLVMPRMFRKKPDTEWPKVRDELNNLMNFARQESISKQKPYRLAFYAKPKEPDVIQVEREEDNLEKPGTKKFVPAPEPYYKGEYILPEAIKIQAVYEGKVDTLQENKNKAYCYIVPDGLASDAMIHMRRILSGVESRGTFIVQPFLGSFEFQEGFVKPGKQKE